MDYGRIVSRSFEIAWQHKWLWIFGMFAAGTGLNIKFEYVFGSSPTNPFDMQGMEAIDPTAMLAAYAGFIPLFIIMALMVVFAKGAIIDSVNRIERGGTFSFSSAFSAGADYFLRFFGIGILFFVVWMAYFIFVILLIVLLFSVNTIVGVFGMIIAFFVSLPVIFALVQISNLADRVIVIRNSGIFDAISEGFLLLKMHFGKNIAAFFIIFAFGVAFGIFIFIMWLFVMLPIDAVIQALNLASYPAMFAALILGLPFSYITAGFMGLFSNTFMTLFYIELVDPKPESAYFPHPPHASTDNTEI